VIGRTLLALALAPASALALAGCGFSGSAGSSDSTTTSQECVDAQRALEDVTNYDAETNPSPTISSQQAMQVSRIIADNPTCFDPDLVKAARAALSRTSTAPTTTSGG
jgi:hypothetical protein